MSDVSLQVREILAECIPGCFYAPEIITMEHRLADDLGADALDLFDACVLLEEKFGVEITDETTEGFETVGDVVDFIMDREAEE